MINMLYAIIRIDLNEKYKAWDLEGYSKIKFWRDQVEAYLKNINHFYIEFKIS